MNSPPTSRHLKLAANAILAAVFSCLWITSLSRAQPPLGEWLQRESASQDTAPLQGLENWRFLRSEIRHLAALSSGKTAASMAAPALSAIRDFHKALAARSIRLVLVPIPEKARLRIDKLAAGFSAQDGLALDQAADALYRQFRKKDIEVLDLTAAFRAELSQGTDPGYCRTDSHFSPRFCELSAQQLAGLCRSNVPTAELPPSAFRTQATSINISGDLALAGDRETLACRKVTLAAGGGVIAPAARSPVMLLGDSHCLIFHAGADMLASSTGLSDHLAASLGVLPSVVAVRGGGSTSSRVNLYRAASKDQSLLPSTKVVLWVLAARDLTQAQDWKSVPLPK
jgi:hypothetical protein